MASEDFQPSQSDNPSREESSNAPAVSLDNVIVPQPNEDDVINPVTWFNTTGLVELEIGCGKGGFLLRRATEFPDRRFVGIEWANKFYKFAADRMARWHITNVRILRTDAEVFVKRHLAPDSLSALHIYHPDPWPKKRHHKRRLIQAEFVESAIRTLTTGARWSVQTDHEEYFDQIQHLLRNHNRLGEVPFESDDASIIDGKVQTNFEVKYRREGRPIYRLACIKTR
jgi:tRNA (guanine-N7-)-methyltransferase